MLTPEKIKLALAEIERWGVEEVNNIGWDTSEDPSVLIPVSEWRKRGFVAEKMESFQGSRFTEEKSRGVRFVCNWGKDEAQPSE